MNKSIPAFLASALLLAAALPAAAAPEGPPSLILDTEQAYTMTPLAAFASGGLGGTGGGLSIRNGLPGNWEWWLAGTNLNLTGAFTLNTDLGAKYQYMQTGGGLAGAVYAAIQPAVTSGAFGLGATVGIPFSQSLSFGNFTFAPNLQVNTITAGPTETLNFNLALVAPIGAGWLLTVEDIPRYSLNGGGFADSAVLGGRFVPAPNTALDIRILGYDTVTGFSAGILGVTGYVGW